MEALVGVAWMGALVCFATLLFMVVIWNLGVVGLAAAVGLVVGKIGFWTSFGAVCLLALTWLLVKVQVVFS